MVKIKNVVKGPVAKAVVHAPIMVALEPLAREVIKLMIEEVDKRKQLISIPELIFKDTSVGLEQGLPLLEELGLKVLPVAIREADVKYKDYFDLQIVESKPKQKQKVAPGTLVILKYVTSEIIEESKKIYEELEEQKIEAREEKKNKRIEQKEKMNQMVANTVSKTKQGANDVVDKVKEIRVLPKKKVTPEELDI